MKTSIYLATLLVCAIQVMVHGQTPASPLKKDNRPLLASSLRLTRTSSAALPAIVKNNQDLTPPDNETPVPLTREEKFKTDRILELKQIQASVLALVSTQQEFKNNRSLIQALLTKGNYETTVSDRVETLITEAERAMRLATEMREEADAQPTIPARLGGIGNAEEKELAALGKQKETLALLEKNYRSSFRLAGESLAGVAH